MVTGLNGLFDVGEGEGVWGRVARETLGGSDLIGVLGLQNHEKPLKKRGKSALQRLPRAFQMLPRAFQEPSWTAQRGLGPEGPQSELRYT